MNLEDAKAARETTCAVADRIRKAIGETEERLAVEVGRLEGHRAEVERVRGLRRELLADGLPAKAETAKLKELSLNIELLEDTVSGLEGRLSKLRAERNAADGAVLAADGALLEARGRELAAEYNETAARLEEISRRLWALRVEVFHHKQQGGARMDVGPYLFGFPRCEEDILAIPRIYCGDRPLTGSGKVKKQPPDLTAGEFNRSE